jgi:2-haloacid dehalogenase
MKPQDRIYLASEELAGCTGRQIFFTDDRSENVAAAAARGWSTYHYRTTDELIACLNEWLIQNYEC